MLLERGEMVMLGGAEDVITEYHDRLAAQDNPDDHAEPTVRREQFFDAEVAVLNERGEQHHQFTEGEPFAIRLRLHAKQAVENATVGLSLRDELGREIGTRTIAGVPFGANERRTVELGFAEPRLRNGLFQVSVGVTDSASGTVLLELEAAETLSVYGQVPESGGPVQLGGSWTLS